MIPGQSRPWLAIRDVCPRHQRSRRTGRGRRRHPPQRSASDSSEHGVTIVGGGHRLHRRNRGGGPRHHRSSRSRSSPATPRSVAAAQIGPHAVLHNATLADRRRDPLVHRHRFLESAPGPMSGPTPTCAATPDRRRGACRHLGRNEEQRTWRRHPGGSLLLPRRCHPGRAREHRRRHDHGQLRRRHASIQQRSATMSSSAVIRSWLRRSPLATGPAPVPARWLTATWRRSATVVGVPARPIASKHRIAAGTGNADDTRE